MTDDELFEWIYSVLEVTQRQEDIHPGLGNEINMLLFHIDERGHEAALKRKEELIAWNKENEGKCNIKL